MTDILDRVLPLWAGPLPPGAEALDAFRDVYTDPVRVNGVSTPLRDLVDRARMMQAALADLRADIVERVDGPGRIAFAFRLSGHHVGSLMTPIGAIEPSGRHVEVLALDVLELSGERIAGVWAVSDQLGLVVQAGAAGLLRPAGG